MMPGVVIDRGAGVERVIGNAIAYVEGHLAAGEGDRNQVFIPRIWGIGCDDTRAGPGKIALAAIALAGFQP